ncbi:hypothetical protein E5222_15920 [Alteraurantiacibacter aquimixticola]|uniref:Uncharacterized protein n=2 Tax=Alteraurantiacibacter aquimixticola TaxID=2489173 RepID=A0A4T3EZK1_9SPHN|nr:hypothetical protein E5222_15920 [Alteraurantiacibacter aquimixticola]
MKALLAIAVIIGGVAWFYGDAMAGYARAGTAYGAKNGCSCRHIGGRDLASCRDDKVDGMAAVFLTEDEDDKSVTATVPLIASETARYHEGFGCVLDSWED